ncbi:MULTISPECIES: NADH-ubiquinone oxidoreductase-F iron-sulfur binding region domain-containing protein [unclassified Nocardia]|uniref:NADH-ubiquinone oxidoreductase-F iron-sulfur binding region domain-containing protein n=1 Tax=unclassified Nocardia TaxID=2637762 RepID=UPI0024A86740|nr:MULTISPECIES: NADH-ubiquinone oxidoreductase-F iron-sulfur binding region domain-containing protein [unclassified Nocardia]
MESRPRDWMAVRAHRVTASATHVTGWLRNAADAHGEIRRGDIDAIATAAHLPQATVAGSASFYADLTEPRPISVCDGTGCFVARGGYPAAPGPDERSVYCLGSCHAAPAELHGETLLSGSERTPAPPIPYACRAAEPVVLAGLVGDAQPWQVWAEVVETRRQHEIWHEVVRSGLRGRGGAEYVVSAKWRAAVRNPAPRYVVANGDEGDPGSYCDRLLMEYDPHRVLEGMALCAAAVGADRGIVLVRSEYPVAARTMRAAIDQARASGQLGRDIHGSGLDFDVTVQVGAGAYVAGEETALLRSLEGLRGTVQTRPPYPTECGYGGRPTVLQNVETLAAVPWIVRNCGESYAKLGRPEETGTKLVCLNSEFTRPGVYEVEFGASLRWIVEDLGGGLRDGHRLRALQVGGPLGGFLAPDELDTGLATADLAERGVSLGHGSLVAVPDTVGAVDLLRQLWTFAARESCGACAPCRVGTRRGQELAERMDAAEPAADATMRRLLDIMRTGSMCAFGTGVAAAVRSLLRVYGIHDRG